MDHHRYPSSSQQYTSTGSSTFPSHNDAPFSQQHLHLSSSVSAPTSHTTTSNLSLQQQIIAQQQQFQPLQGSINGDGSRGGGNASPPFPHHQSQPHINTPQSTSTPWTTSSGATASFDQLGGGHNNNTLSPSVMDYSSIASDHLNYQSTNHFNWAPSLNPSTQQHYPQQPTSSSQQQQQVNNQLIQHCGVGSNGFSAQQQQPTGSAPYQHQASSTSLQERGGQPQQYFLPTTTSPNLNPPRTITITPSSPSPLLSNNNNNNNSGFHFGPQLPSTGYGFNTPTGPPFDPSYFGNTSPPFSMSGYAPLPMSATSGVVYGGNQASNNDGSSTFYPSYPSQHHHQIMRNFNMDLGGAGGGPFFYNNSNVTSYHLPSTVSHHQPFHQQHQYNRHYLPHYSQAPARLPTKMPTAHKTEKKKAQPPPPPPPPVISTDDHVKSQLHRQCDAIVAHDLTHEVEECDWFMNRASWKPTPPTTDAVAATTTSPSTPTPGITTSPQPPSAVGSPVVVADVVNGDDNIVEINCAYDPNDTLSPTHSVKPTPPTTPPTPRSTSGGDQVAATVVPTANTLSDGPFTKLIVNAVASTVTNSDLYEIFSAFGKIEGCRIAQDRARNRSKGYAFVYFENYKDATEALLHCNYIEVKGRQLRVTFSVNPLNKMLFTSSSEEDEETAEKKEEEDEVVSAENRNQQQEVDEEEPQQHHRPADDGPPTAQDGNAPPELHTSVTERAAINMGQVPRNGGGHLPHY